MARPQPRYKKGDMIGGEYHVYDVKMGGMGEVYLCLNFYQKRPLVALKTFQSQFLKSTKIRQDFEIEAVNWIALGKHPNIVQCFLMERFEGVPFLFLECVTDENGHDSSLRSWLSHGPLNLQLALDFIIDICNGLMYANHQQSNIVHRDLKPDNILVGLGRVAKITDWGLAKVTEEIKQEVDVLNQEISERQSLIAINGVVGTPPYMAPEQWTSGTKVDFRTDIYAVGCILYELLTGKPPFRVDFIPYTMLERAKWLTAWKSQHEYTIPHEFPAFLPKELSEVVSTCLAKNPNERFTSVSELLHKLTLIYQQQFNTPARTFYIEQELNIEDYLERGQTYHNLGYYTEALMNYDCAVELNPKESYIYARRGVTKAYLRRYDEALDDCNQAIEFDPNSGINFILRGMAYEKMRRYDEALIDFKKAANLDLTPTQLHWAYEQMGDLLIDMGRYEEALNVLTIALQISPNCGISLGYRGKAYKLMQRYDEALADLDRAIYLDPGNTTAFHTRIDTYRSMGDLDKALADLDQAIQLKPDPALYTERGETYRLCGHFDEAVASFNLALQDDPDYFLAISRRGAAYENLGRYEEALADLDRAIELKPDSTFTLGERGWTYSQMKHYDEAFADFNQALMLDSNDNWILEQRARTYTQLQRYNEALDDCNQAIQLGPQRPSLFTLRIEINWLMENYLAALTEFKHFVSDDSVRGDINIRVQSKEDFSFNNLSLNNSASRFAYLILIIENHTNSLLSHSALAHSNLGNIYQQAKLYDKALEHLQCAIDLDPLDASAYFNRGMVYLELKKYDLALDNYDKTIELNPNLDFVYIDRGNTYHELQRYNAALADYTQAIVREPKSAIAYTNRGTTYRALRQYDDALADHSYAISLDPNYAQAYINRGAVFHDLGQYETALTDFNRAIALDSHSALAFFNRGNAYVSLHQYDKATRDYNRTIELDANNVIAYFNLGALLFNAGQPRESLLYLEQAARLGLSQATQVIAQVRQSLGESTPLSQVDPTQAAFEAFQQADSPAAMRQAVVQFPFTTQPDFIAAIEQTIAQQVPPEHRPAFEQRLAWLRQIANEQQEKE